MAKGFIRSVLVMTLLLGAIVPVQAAVVNECTTEVLHALEGVMSGSEKTGFTGYVQRLGNLTSTNVPTYQLIEEVQQLARDARMEMKGICREVEKQGGMREEYVRAYDLASCQQSGSDTSGGLSVVEYCRDTSEELLDKFLNSLRGVLLQQAIRTSVEPMVQKMRSLNERLATMLSEYSRLINNFYTFNFRLGEKIVPDSD